MKEIFDSLHGYIPVDTWILKIIDTTEFQRLRKIKQLGLVYNVFASACHNRYEHSLGVYYLACRYIQYLELNSDTELFSDTDKRNIKTAALIHDIGHGPYSHLWDETFNGNHEARSKQIFRYMNDKYMLQYSEKDIDYINHMIKSEKSFSQKYPNETRNYLFQIVSNPNGIDVDRMDYIMRDVKMTGLSYGIESYEIMKQSIVRKNNIIFRNKCQLIIDNFFQVRYILYKTIYNHPTVRSIELMVGEILKEIKKSEQYDLDNLRIFLLMNDSIIDTFIINNPNSKVEQIMNNINTRNIYKIKEQKIIYSNEIEYNTIEKTLENYDSRDIIDKNIIQYNAEKKPLFENSEMEDKQYLQKKEIIVNIFFNIDIK